MSHCVSAAERAPRGERVGVDDDPTGPRLISRGVWGSCRVAAPLVSGQAALEERLVVENARRVAQQGAKQGQASEARSRWCEPKAAAQAPAARANRREDLASGASDP